MKRFVLGLSVLIIGIGVRVVPAAAQDKAAAAPADSSKDGTDIAGAVSTQNAPANPGEAARRTWEDVVVVPRKAFLKSGRLELFPYTGVSINDVLIRHYAFGGELNYYLSDVFSVGLEGQYYLKERTDRESLVGLQYNRVSTLNRYLWAGSINFGYVPGYGKFTMFNRYIIHWDLYIQGGVGLIQTEIIPRIAGDEAFKNNRIMPNVGIGTHLFLSNWLSFNFAVKDYIFNDLFEPTARGRSDSIEMVKARASSQLIQNVMIYAGIGIYLPTSFQYRTPR